MYRVLIGARPVLPILSTVSTAALASRYIQRERVKVRERCLDAVEHRLLRFADPVCVPSSTDTTVAYYLRKVVQVEACTLEIKQSVRLGTRMRGKRNTADVQLVS
jgi:hypothetical protein